jgi:hypothetical protein
MEPQFGIFPGRPGTERCSKCSYFLKYLSVIPALNSPGLVIPKVICYSSATEMKYVLFFCEY